MHTVNVWHVGNFIAHLMVLDGAEYVTVAALDPDDRAAFRRVIAKHLAPRYASMRPHGQVKLKESLRYVLNVRPDSVEDMIDAMQDVPVSSDHPFTMLEELWSVLFPSEDYRLLFDRYDYVEADDDVSGKEIFAPDGGWPDPK